MKIAIAIATTGRPGIVGEALARFMRLDRKADRLLVVGASQSDAPTEPHDAGFAISPTKGSSAQRNHALDLIGDDADVIVFVDDDFAPAPGFLEGVERLFAEHADIVAASGELIADGATRGGYTFEQADAFISAWRTPIVEQLRELVGRLWVQHGLSTRERAAAALRRKSSALWLAGGHGLFGALRAFRTRRSLQSFRRRASRRAVRSRVRRAARLFADRQSAVSAAQGNGGAFLCARLWPRETCCRTSSNPSGRSPISTDADVCAAICLRSRTRCAGGLIRVEFWSSRRDCHSVVGFAFCNEDREVARAASPIAIIARSPITSSA